MKRVLNIIGFVLMLPLILVAGIVFLLIAD